MVQGRTKYYLAVINAPKSAFVLLPLSLDFLSNSSLIQFWTYSCYCHYSSSTTSDVGGKSWTDLCSDHHEKKKLFWTKIYTLQFVEVPLGALKIGENCEWFPPKFSEPEPRRRLKKFIKNIENGEQNSESYESIKSIIWTWWKMKGNLSENGGVQSPFWRISCPPSWTKSCK